MAKSSRKRRKNQGGVVAVLLIVLVFTCIGLLIVAGYNVNTGIATYAIIITIACAVMYLYWKKNYKFVNNQNSQYSQLLDENAELIREINRINRSHRKDCNEMNDQMLVFEHQKNIADRAARLHRRKYMEAEEILERLKKDYPEIEPIIVAYKAEIEEAQKAAKKAADAIKKCISVYKDSGSVEELQEACSLYLGLSAKERMWVPAKKKLMQELGELIKKLREGSENALASETEMSETDESVGKDFSVLEETDPEVSEMTENIGDLEDVQQDVLGMLEDTSEA